MFISYFFMMLDNIFSFLSDILYSPYPALIALIANICAILWFLYKNRKQDKVIQDLQLQVQLSNNNSNSLEQVQNKIIWYSADDVIKLINEFMNTDIKDKFVDSEHFKDVLLILIKYIEHTQSQIEHLKKWIDLNRTSISILEKKDNLS